MKLVNYEEIKKASANFSEGVHLKGDLLRKYQLTLVSMAEDIIEVCEENGIMYQLSGGSTLGAVREGGFIPWDDDIDMNMLGSQFEKFVRCFRKKYGYKYWIHTYDTEDYGITFSRIRLKNSVCRTNNDLDNTECGFFIDIFCLENVFDNIILRKIHGFFCLALGLLVACRRYYKEKEVLRKVSASNRSLKRAVEFKIFIGRLISFLSVRQVAVIAHKCYSLCKNNKSKYLTIPDGQKHYFGEMYLRENMQETVECDFEGHKWRVPKDYDGYLRVLFGDDYMTPPPENERETHVFLELKFPDEIK